MASPGAAALRKRGILFIMHSLSQGGADRVAVLLANGFAAAGIRTRIALMRDIAEGQPEIRAMLDPRITVASAGPAMGLRLSRNGPPLGHRHLERARGVRFVRSHIDAHGPAIIFAPTDNMGLITALARPRGSGEPLFAMKLTNALLRPGSGPAKSLYRRKLFDFIFHRLDLVLALSEAERRQLSDFYPSQEQIFQTVPNPYVTDAMLVDFASAHSASPQLITAGRMVPQKRFDVLLQAFADVACKDARLTILGDGPLRHALESQAKSLGIVERVDMPGYTSDVLPRLRQSSLFVLSSDYEGLPAVVLEALASGVPVVSSDSFLAAREMLGGLPACAVVPIRDPSALASAIDRSLVAKRRADDLRSIAMPYRVEAAVTAHIETFARLLGEKNQAAA